MTFRSTRTFFLSGILALAVSCGPDGNPAEENHDSGQIESDAEWAEANRKLLETIEYQAAADRAKACIEEAGFTSDGTSIILRDGSRYEPGVAGGFLDITYATAEYLSASERCARESGVAGLRDAAGVGDQAPDPASVRGLNEAFVARIACLEARGWEFREILTVFGGVLFTEPILQPGQLEAFELEEQQCITEAGG